MDGKTGGSARPDRVFRRALPIYILRRIYHRMCMFLISWMHSRAHARTSASMPNIQRSTNSWLFPLLPIRFPPFLFSRRVLARLMLFPLISTQIRDLLSAFLSLSLFLVSLSLSRVFNIFVLVPRISSPFLFSLVHFVIL